MSRSPSAGGAVSCGSGKLDAIDENRRESTAAPPSVVPDDPPNLGGEEKDANRQLSDLQPGTSRLSRFCPRSLHKKQGILITLEILQKHAAMSSTTKTARIGEE